MNVYDIIDVYLASVFALFVLGVILLLK